MRILVVEDDQFVREYLGLCLRDDGHEVLISGDARAALALIEAEPHPELLVSDLDLGSEIDGVDVAERFRLRIPGGPVVFVSGRPDLARDRITQERPATLLQKPFLRRDLLAAIASARASAHVDS